MSTSNETNIQLQAILDAAKAIVQCKHDGNGLCDGGYSLCGSCGAVSKFGDPWELSPSVKRLADALEVLPPMRDDLPDTIASVNVGVDVRDYAPVALDALIDSCFTQAQVAFRRRVRLVQDKALGSRESLREKLEAAVDALKWYADQSNRAQAKAVLDFIDGSCGTNMEIR